MIHDSKSDVSIEVDICEDTDEPLKHKRQCDDESIIAFHVPYYLLHFLDDFRMGDVKYLKENLDEGHGAIHGRIEVTRQQLFCYLLENKEDLLISEAFFNEKQNDSIHPLTVTNIRIVLGNTRQSFSQPLPHFCLSKLFLDV